jgi:hypothetical protein
MTIYELLFQILSSYHQLGNEKSVQIYRESINGYRKAELDESLFLLDNRPFMIYSFLIRLEQSELRNGETVGVTSSTKRDIHELIVSSQLGTDGKNKKHRKRTRRSKLKVNSM